MRKSDVVTMVDYMYWVDHLLLDEADQLEPEVFRSFEGGTVRDLRSTLVHALDVEWSWRCNLEGRGASAEDDLDPEEFPDVATLRERWRKDEAEMRTWLDGLGDDAFEAPVDSGYSRDRRPLWEYVIHIVTHSQQQQADAATLLTQADQSPGEIGFLKYLNEARATETSAPRR